METFAAQGRKTIVCYHWSVEKDRAKYASPRRSVVWDLRYRGSQNILSIQVRCEKGTAHSNQCVDHRYKDLQGLTRYPPNKVGAWTSTERMRQCVDRGYGDHHYKGSQKYPSNKLGPVGTSLSAEDTIAPATTGSTFECKPSSTNGKETFAKGGHKRSFNYSGCRKRRADEGWQNATHGRLERAVVQSPDLLDLALK
jgi:hypothetical protein